MKKYLKIILPSSLLLLFSLLVAFNYSNDKIDKEEYLQSIKNIYNKRSEVSINGNLSSLPQYSDNFQEYEKWAYGKCDSENEGYLQLIENIYNKRSEVFINGDLSSLPQYFDTSQKYGKWALENEVRRVKYLRHWGHQRGIVFTDINSKVILNKVTKTDSGVKLSLKEICKFSYVYKDDQTPITNNFAVGLRHNVHIINKDDKWVIRTDWYTDCFGDALKAYTGDPVEMDLSGEKVYSLPNCPKVIDYDTSKKYNRKKAVEYADKYSGASLEEGTDYKYNKKYKDFNGIGGDCTNYVSQVLGDKEAGELKSDGTWYCAYNKFGGSEGSKAWVNADAFKNYLIYSGKGALIKKGTFEKLIVPDEKFPCGAVGKLEPGDLVCYALGNDIDHFAVVTAFDSHGYPLINSHTTDRYHVPWDLGWGDKNVYFHLIHIR
ncbi:amidase domain-containing protein [uncultured Clostridium sp.]|uniref:amidase domain-containing protein n=1 Tax=uncultured Clostridium sp. TaxID=59620 RepID=UPI0028E60B9B|nr:amidase domain-containing protein [uncultured Clostridium sp.]